jgi:hypothetical protein
MSSQGKSVFLRGGHAPGFLRDIFCEALDNCGFNPELWVDALSDELGGWHLHEREHLRWLKMSNTERALWLTGHLWHSTDIMPSAMCQELEMPMGSTYARAVRLLRPTVTRESP